MLLLYAVSLDKSGGPFLCCCSKSPKFLKLVKVTFRIGNISANWRLLSIYEISSRMVSAAAINRPVAWSISTNDKLCDISASSNAVIVESGSLKLSNNKNNPHSFLFSRCVSTRTWSKILQITVPLTLVDCAASAILRAKHFIVDHVKVHPVNHIEKLGWPNKKSQIDQIKS